MKKPNSPVHSPRASRLGPQVGLSGVPREVSVPVASAVTVTWAARPIFTLDVLFDT